MKITKLYSIQDYCKNCTEFSDSVMKKQETKNIFIETDANSSSRQLRSERLINQNKNSQEINENNFFANL